MAVESRFVVIRNGVEVETFMDKKAADEYDKMLDMADSLSDLFDQSALELNEKMVEEVSIFIAKNREDVLVALQAKKAKVTKPAVIEDEVVATVDASGAVKKGTVKKAKKTTKAKA